MYEFKINKLAYIVNFFLPFIILVLFNFTLLHWIALYYIIIGCSLGVIFASFVIFKNSNVILKKGVVEGLSGKNLVFNNFTRVNIKFKNVDIRNSRKRNIYEIIFGQYRIKSFNSQDFLFDKQSILLERIFFGWFRVNKIHKSILEIIELENIRLSDNKNIEK